jgi:hypothetical protein
MDECIEFNPRLVQGSDSVKKVKVTAGSFELVKFARKDLKARQVVVRIGPRGILRRGHDALFSLDIPNALGNAHTRICAVAGAAQPMNS